MSDRPWWKRLLGLAKPPRQTCWVYCPGCRVDLCTEPDTDSTDTDLVRYVCGRCGVRSAWNFDVAPVPILVETKPALRTLAEDVAAGLHDQPHP